MAAPCSLLLPRIFDGRPKRGASDAAEPVSVKLWSQVIDPTRDYFSEFLLPPNLPTNMSELGRVLIDTLRYVHPESGAVSYDPA
jgi:hypothetical protein